MKHKTMLVKSILPLAVVSVSFALAGCGKPAPPPPGAPSETNAPEIDLGNDTPPQEAPPAADKQP